MDLLEKLAMNIKESIQEYGENKFDAGKLEGYHEGLEQGEPKERELLTFAIEKFKEAAERAVSFEQILLELESDLCKYMPVHGLSSKQFKAKF